VTAGWLTVIGTITTAILGPLLAWFLKRWWDKKAEKAATEAREKVEVEAAQKNSEAQSGHAGQVNESIDKQREAREKWARENPGVPHP
jgi:hypothetical protein